MKQGKEENRGEQEQDESQENGSEEGDVKKSLAAASSQMPQMAVKGAKLKGDAIGE